MLYDILHDFGNGALMRLAYMPFLLLSAYVITTVLSPTQKQKKKCEGNTYAFMDAPLCIFYILALIENVLFFFLFQDVICRLLGMSPVDARAVTSILFAVAHSGNTFHQMIGIYIGECIPVGYAKLQLTHGFMTSYGAHVANNLLLVFMVRLMRAYYNYQKRKKKNARRKKYKRLIAESRSQPRFASR